MIGGIGLVVGVISMISKAADEHYVIEEEGERIRAYTLKVLRIGAIAGTMGASYALFAVDPRSVEYELLL